MAMHCERDLEREREMESIERRSRRLKALVDEWTSAIEEVAEEPYLEDETIAEFEKTMPMTANSSKRSH
jgi:hypothetical protein